MTRDEALRMAIEAIENADYHNDLQAIAVIKDIMAQPEQEPVAWMNDSTPSGIFARHMEGAKNFGCTIPLYTTPPQRKPLTDEEISAIDWKSDETLHDFARAIEAKLKEKNT